MDYTVYKTEMNYQHLDIDEMTIVITDQGMGTNRSIILSNIFLIWEYRWWSKAEEKQNWVHKHLYIFAVIKSRFYNEHKSSWMQI